MGFSDFRGFEQLLAPIPATCDFTLRNQWFRELFGSQYRKKCTIQLMLHALSQNQHQIASCLDFREIPRLSWEKHFPEICFRESKEDQAPECPEDGVGDGSWDPGHQAQAAPESGGP